MKIINQVYETSAYNDFVFISSNRDIVANINLENSIRESGVIVPVVVNEKMEVIDGQHRITLAEKAGKPVPFIITKGLSKKDMIPINNSSKNWTLMDYIQTFEREGLANYIDLMDIYENNDVTMNTLISIASNSTDRSKAHKKARVGNFEFYDVDVLNEFLASYKNLQESMIGSIPSNLPLVVYSLYRNKNFDFKRLISKSNIFSDKIKGITGHSELMQKTLEIYHQGLSSKSKKVLQWRFGVRGEVVFTGELKEVFKKG